ncbi:N-acetylglucosamine-6-phosphate deacetylase [Paraferrimonas sedimenticola]|uniref:N-acetylgalactosamine-6-phosphate deacetylase n=1 Tax=Paraferrimonas sedimenticola TaxID=375674 RepID=A0AA37RSC7_9GAMM|nr:N-acetylglucosamine-6-phosphate deacetylase [Paraferrimonas sedimenticola]GLP95070.1 N-acetylgalactosamine-6-phosphate deacetylase [Paraferrimonas sedimenticola]
MSMIGLLADRVFNGERWLEETPIFFDDSGVVSLSRVEGVAIERMSGALVPGFIDTQVNGGGGVLFNQAPSVDSLKVMMAAHRRFGTTAMTPTLISDRYDTLCAGADAVAEAIDSQVAGIVGMHFEGPHLAVAKRGVHRADVLRPMSDAEMAQFCRDDLGQVIVTLAPEVVPVSQIKELVAAGVVVSLGHTNADCDTAIKAIEAGAKASTHLFNAMSAFGSREPGVVGASLLTNELIAGIIVDGHHVDYRALQLAYRLKGVDGLMLVTDAMSPVGTDIESFDLQGRTILRQGDRLNAQSGELAGCVLDMASAVRNCVDHMGCALAHALQMASRTPASLLGLSESKGHLQPGADADLLLIDDDLQVKRSWIAGKEA